MFVVGGESLIDLISKPVKADGTRELLAKAGGSPMNCAIALARLGLESGFLCPISSDTFGDVILEPLRSAGVTQLIKDRVREPTTLAVVTDDGKGNPRYAFYREADRAFTREGLIAALPDKVELFQIGGFCTILDEDLEVWLDVAAEAERRGATISTDPNLRPSLISDMDAYRARIRRSLEIASIVKLSSEDMETLEPGKPIDAQALDMLARPKCRLVVVTLGAEGSIAFTRKARFRSPIYPAAPGGDNVGAGDTLMAGILTWLSDHDALKPDSLDRLDEAALQQMLWFGAVAAGINCGRVGANPPTRAEVDAVLAN
ncbi:MAG TPA: carbohydrate kinase [Devosia sp.]|nr:carbohydrate kinase [Devosia sp.]